MFAPPMVVCPDKVFGPSEALLDRLPRCIRIPSRSRLAVNMGHQRRGIAAGIVVVRGIHCYHILVELGRRCWLVRIPTCRTVLWMSIEDGRREEGVKENPALYIYSRQHSLTSVFRLYLPNIDVHLLLSIDLKPPPC